MDLDLGFLTAGLTQRSLMGLCGGSLTSEEVIPKEFKVNEINDFTTNALKDEEENYNEKKKIPTSKICPAYHGGPLDYPKISSKSIADIVAKWEICFLTVEKAIEIHLEKKASEPTDEKAEGDEMRDHLNSDDEVYEKLTGKQAPTKRTKSSTIRHAIAEEEDFFSAVSESASKISVHCSAMVKKMLVDGNTGGLLATVGGLALARNKIWFYNELIIIHPKCQFPFNDNYKELSSYVEAAAEQIANYLMALAATTVLHDAPSQNWTSVKPFFEGEKISHCVQMWLYFLHGLHYDLWNTLPPKVASNMFGKIFDHTYGILVGRYTKVSPSSKRLQQYRADMTTILLIATEVLTYVAGSTYKMLGEKNPTAFGGHIVWSIHTKSKILFAALALVGSPLHALYKSAMDSMKPKLKTANLEPLKEKPDDLITWMHMIRPGIYHSPNMANLSAESHIVILAKLIANQSSPSWPLIIQLMLSHDRVVSKTILLHFGAFIPASPHRSSSTDSKVETKKESSMNEGCGGFECRKVCIGRADIHWPQAVGSAVLKLIICGRVGGRDCLSSALSDLFDRMSGASWEAINKSQLWNPRRPIWLQGLIHCVEPYIFPAIVELLDLIDSGRTWTLNQVQTAMKEVLTCAEEMIPEIPVCILKVCYDNIQNRLPHGVEPLDNCCFTHVLVCALYGMIMRLQNVLTREKVSREKLDFVIAFGEALISLDSSTEIVNLSRAGKKALEDAEAEEKDEGEDTEENSTLFDSIIHEHAYAVAEQVSGDILMDCDGPYAMRVLHR